MFELLIWCVTIFLTHNWPILRVLCAPSVRMQWKYVHYHHHYRLSAVLLFFCLFFSFLLLFLLLLWLALFNSTSSHFFSPASDAIALDNVFLRQSYTFSRFNVFSLFLGIRMGKVCSRISYALRAFGYSCVNSTRMRITDRNYNVIISNPTTTWTNRRHYEIKSNGWKHKENSNDCVVFRIHPENARSRLMCAGFKIHYSPLQVDHHHRMHTIWLRLYVMYSKF